MKVRCATCHREELWEGDAVEVLLEGGKRRPRVNPALQAWRTLSAARQRGEAPVGTCVCGQPLLGPADRAVPWTLDAPGGAFDIAADGTITGAEGPIQPDALDARLEGELGPGLFDDVDPVQTTMQLVLMTPLSVIFFLWVIAAVTVGMFLFSFAQRPGFG